MFLEAKVEQVTFLLSEEEERCRMCGKPFKPYKVRTHGQEFGSAICKECRSKTAEC
jgi:ribosome-binding protein aMBF1 (putative translation factor)